MSRSRLSPMTRRLAAAVFAITLLVAACGGSSGNVASDADVSEAPTRQSEVPTSSATAQTVSGSEIDFNSLEGTDTVLWFWAPW